MTAPGSSPATSKPSRRLPSRAACVLCAIGLAALLTACSGSLFRHRDGSTAETAGAAEVSAWGETTEIASLFPAEVEDAELAQIRGGMITVGGFELDFGFVLETLIDGVMQAQTVVNLTDGGALPPGVPINDTVTVLSQGGGVTEIIHQVGPGGVSSTVLNTASGITIEQSLTLTVDVLNHMQFVDIVRSGSPLGAGRQLPNIIKDALIGAIAE